MNILDKIGKLIRPPGDQSHFFKAGREAWGWKGSDLLDDSAADIVKRIYALEKEVHALKKNKIDHAPDSRHRL